MNVVDGISMGPFRVGHDSIAWWVRRDDRFLVTPRDGEDPATVRRFGPSVRRRYFGSRDAARAWCEEAWLVVSQGLLPAVDRPVWYTRVEGRGRVHEGIVEQAWSSTVALARAPHGHLDVLYRRAPGAWTSILTLPGLASPRSAPVLRSEVRDVLRRVEMIRGSIAHAWQRHPYKLGSFDEHAEGTIPLLRRLVLSLGLARRGYRIEPWRPNDQHIDGILLLRGGKRVAHVPLPHAAHDHVFVARGDVLAGLDDAVIFWSRLAHSDRVTRGALGPEILRR